MVVAPAASLVVVTVAAAASLLVVMAAAMEASLAADAYMGVDLLPSLPLVAVVLMLQLLAVV